MRDTDREGHIPGGRSGMGVIKANETACKTWQVAFDALPDWQKEVWETAENYHNIVSYEYCGYEKTALFFTARKRGMVEAQASTQRDYDLPDWAVINGERISLFS